MDVALKLLTTFGPTKVLTAPVTPILELDYTNNRYVLNGVVYDTEADLLTAAGAERVSSVVTFKPQDLTANKLTNPTMDGTYAAPSATGNPDGWAPSPSYTANTPLAISGGAMRVQPPGVGQARWSKTIPDHAFGKAWRFKITQTSLNTKTGQIGSSTNADVGGSQSVTTFASTGDGSPENFFASESNSGMYIGLVISGVTTEYTYDNAELMEVAPLTEWNYAARAAIIEGVTPASVSGNQVVWQSDANNERNRQRLVFDGSGNLRLICTAYNSELVNFDFGAIGTSTPFSIHASFKKNRVFARLDDGVSKADYANDVAGATHMRLGNSFTGEAWGGSITGLQIFDDEYLPSDVLALFGDSYVAGAGGVSLGVSAIASRAAWYEVDTGGFTLAQIRDRVLLARQVAALAPIVIWDGNGANGYSTTANALSDYAKIAAVKADGRFLIIGPLRRANLSEALNNAMSEVQAGLLARYGERYVDAQAILASHATSPGDDADVLANVVPTSLLQGDASHLNSTGMNHVYTDGVAAKLTAFGW